MDNEIVSNQIAKIANLYGFKEPCRQWYKEFIGLVRYESEPVDYDYCEYHSLYGKGFYMLPTYTQLINWIFSPNTIQNAIVISKDFKTVVDWLKFWYDTLIPELTFRTNKFIVEYNNFVLNGFIGMLIDWFEQNECYLYVTIVGYRRKYAMLVMYKNDCFESKPIYDTKSEARHEAIKKCFELLK